MEPEVRTMERHRVVFSDKSSFCLYCNSQLRRVSGWRGERITPAILRNCLLRLALAGIFIYPSSVGS
ncbi:hypothetical protein TNCV_1603711 [Trichonephila clavipes]|nr:hypothetical protein TNCV_1603711 [Trichonephila clavipes]